MNIKFGIIGCGGIAHQFASALHLAGEGELQAVAARDPARAKAFAEKYGAKAAYGSYRQLIEDPAVEIVYIALIHSFHYALARRCVAAGKAVLCEKPFFISGAEGEALRQLAAERKVLIMEAMWTRFLPAVQTAKQWMEAGKIGEIKLLHAAFCFRLPYNEETKTGRIYNPDLAGGAFWDAGVYPYDLVTGLLGKQPILVHAAVQPAPSGVDESTALVLRFADGVLATVVSAVGVKAHDDAFVYGTEGYLKLQSFWHCRRCERYDSAGQLAEVFTDPQEEGFVHEIRHIIRLYKEGKTDSPLMPIQDSIDFAKTADQVLESLGHRPLPL